jgi:hypothetical protein
VLEAAGGSSRAVDSDHRSTFVAICAALWNSELYESVCGELSDDVTIENVTDRLRFMSATRRDISAELEFIASHFYDFSRCPDPLNALPFSLLYELIAQGSLRLDSEDSLYDFIRKGIEPNQEIFSLLEIVRCEYYSTDAMDDFFNLLSEHFYKIHASMWASLCARRVLPNGTWKRFLPLVKKGGRFDVPDGIIAHLTRKCGGNVHNHHVIDVTCVSFEKETVGANPYSGAYDNDPDYAATNAVDLENDLCFGSAFRDWNEDIPHTRNNWVCYDCT